MENDDVKKKKPICLANEFHAALVHMACSLTNAIEPCPKSMFLE